MLNITIKWKESLPILSLTNTQISEWTSKYLKITYSNKKYLRPSNYLTKYQQYNYNSKEH